MNILRKFNNLIIFSNDFKIKINNREKRRSTVVMQPIELPNTINIDESEIDVEELSPDGKAMVARVIELRQQLTQTNIQRIELETLIGYWAKNIKESIKPVEETDEPVTMDG